MTEVRDWTYRRAADHLRAQGRAGGPVCLAEARFGATMVGYDGPLALSRVTLPLGAEVGWVLPAVDLAMGRASLANLSPEHTCATISIDLELGGPARPGEALHCLGRHVLDDTGTMIASVEVRGEDDRLVGRGSGRFVAMPGGEPVPVPGLEVATPTGSLVDALGLRDRRDDDGASVWTPASGPDLANPLGVLHGGVQGSMVAEAAVAAVGGGRPLSMRIDYLGALAADAEATLRARPVKAGRRIAFVDVELVASATASAPATIGRVVVLREQDRSVSP